MNALAFHLPALAATEYTTEYTGLTPRFEATAAGIFAVGGGTDAGTELAPVLELGLATGEGTRQQRPRYLYAHGSGVDNLTASVETGAGDRYEYPVQTVRSQVARFVLGAGIRDNYLRVGITGDATLAVTSLSFETMASSNRRI